ncbi:MAG TPA: efflux RND transporter periplasmic adaptor subunit [Lacunisphaera sp.]|jgi:multidrug efflux system membrane fusion protein
MNVPIPFLKRHSRRITGALALGGIIWLNCRFPVALVAAPAAAPKHAGDIPVSAAVAEAQNVDVVLNALGTVTPVSTVTITSRVAGVLQDVHYTEGQMVKEHDLLATIDPRPYQAVLTQAQGQLARDQAVLANARIDLGRYQNAWREHAIPEQQVATQQAVVNEDEGAVKLDQGTVDAAQVNLDYTRIVSPINGRVGLRMVDPGNNVVANGTNGLVTVTQLQPITVVFTLAQEHLPQVLRQMRNGQPLRVEAFDRSNPQAIAQGTLLTIDNQVEQATGAFRLKATFTNEDTVLWPGEFVNLRFIVGVLKNVVTVPARAVQRGPNGSYVYVIKPDLTVALRNVVITQTERDVSVVGQGLAAGERIVVDGQYRLEEGTKVAVQTPGAATGA